MRRCFNSIYEEKSPLEDYAVFSVVYAFLEPYKNDELIGCMYLLVAYQNNCNIVQLAFRNILLELCDIEALDNMKLGYFVGTVSFSQ